MKVVNGAIGGADATKVSADKSSMTSAERQSEFVTKSEVKNQIDLSIKGQTPAQPKENKLSEGNAGAKESQKSAKEAGKNKRASSSLGLVRS